jgi:hypothetical protein
MESYGCVSVSYRFIGKRTILYAQGIFCVFILATLCILIVCSLYFKSAGMINFNQYTLGLMTDNDIIRLITCTSLSCLTQGVVC